MLSAVAEPPVELGKLEDLPPAIRRLVRRVTSALPTSSHDIEGTPLRDLRHLLVVGRPWLGRVRGLAEVGAWMIAPRRAPEIRRAGCEWLSMFPGSDTARRLGKVALDRAAPPSVRDEAIRSLGDRQIRDLDPATTWSRDAVQIADDVLGQVADESDRIGTVTFAQLPTALRHVHSDVTGANFARHPALWASALEAFATPPLARVLGVSIQEVPAGDRIRVMRLIADTLGSEIVPLFVARSADAPPDERIEMLQLAVAFGGEAYLGRLDSALRGSRHQRFARDRAKWHLRNPGLLPTVRGLRGARTTATVAPDSRSAACRRAADDLAAFAAFERHAEPETYRLWAWMVIGAHDPSAARDLVEAYPAAMSWVGDDYLEDLARRGRVHELASAARQLGVPDRGALLLAIWGRPFAALSLARIATAPSPALTCARALACYRVGRPDLCARVLAEDRPPPELTDEVLDGAGSASARFPGPNERWLAENDPRLDPALAALVAGDDAVVRLARACPLEADADVPDRDGIAAVVARLARSLRDTTVFIAGELARATQTRVLATLRDAGATRVAAPIPGTEFFIVGSGVSAETIAELEARGIRRLDVGEVAR